MTFGQSIQTVLHKCAEFRGTARRSEFWWSVLFTSLVSAGLGAERQSVAQVTSPS